MNDLSKLFKLCHMLWKYFKQCYCLRVFNQAYCLQVKYLSLLENRIYQKNILFKAYSRIFKVYDFIMFLSEPRCLKIYP